MAEQKTHKVILRGEGLIAQKDYPGHTPLVMYFPPNVPIELDQSTIDGLDRANNASGRPTHHYEKLADDAAVEGSWPKAVAAVDAELAAQGVTVLGKPTKPQIIGGKYKGMMDVFGEPIISAKKTTEPTTTTPATKGGVE